MIRARALVLCGVALGIPATANASEKRLSADIQATAGFSNNPFSSAGDSGGSPYVELNVNPQFAIVNARSVFTATATARVQQYLRRYPTTGNYRVGLDYSGTPAEHISTHLNASYMSSIVGSAANYSNGIVDPTQPVVVDPVDPNEGGDISLYGTRARRRTINLGGGASAALTAYDQVNASAFYLNTGYGGSTAVGNTSNYTGIGGSFGYSRQLTAHTQLGLRGSLAHYDYEAAGADTTVYSVQPTLTSELNARWSLSASAGVSFVKRPSTSLSKAFSGDLSLCRRGPRTSVCLTARRAVTPTGILGTQATTNVGGNYSYKLTEHSTLGFTADYVNTARPAITQSNGNAFARGRVTYERELRERVRFTSSAYYRKIFGSSLGRAADIGGQIGLAVRLGETR